MRAGPRVARGSFIALTLLLAAGSAPGWAQEPAEQEPAEQEPAMAEAPLQFRLSGTGGVFLWGEEENVPRIDDLALFGLDIESRVVPALAFRLGVSYGRTSAADDTSSVDVNQWMIDLMAVGRLAVRPLVRAGVVPFGLVGLGSVILDPSGDDFRTRSQGAFSIGGGIDLEPRGRWGGRVEFRHYSVSLEDVLDPLDRQGETLSANLILASIYWKL